MQPEPGSPADWLEDARSDLALAQSVSDRPVRWAHRCFYVQQAAEKATKAVLIHCGIEPRRTHHIEQLIRLLPAGVPQPPELIRSTRLTEYALETRSPSRDVPVTEEEYEEALRLAEAVVRWAEDVIGGKAQC